MLSLKKTLLAGISVSTCAIFAQSALAQSAGNSTETVIVTGTRVQGMTAADSAAPIQVLGTDALAHGTGSTDLRQQLGQTVPSFTAQQFANDTANLTLSAALRGLSPNDTLVLVNGHRRHYTGNLHVDAGGFAAGSNSPDLSMIPSAAIDHVEVLLDGAAAQYGTDAVSGVVNIILKNKSAGGVFSATAGDYYDRGSFSGGKANGDKYDLSFNMGLPLFDKGFVNFTISKQYENATQYGGDDARMVDYLHQPVAQNTVTSVGSNGVANLSTVGNGIPNTLIPGQVGYPRDNAINGNPEFQLTMAEVNAGYDFSDNLSVYAFGTIGHKFGLSAQNYRLPNQVIATMGSDQPCSAANPVGYNTGSSTSNGLTASCTGPFALSTANGFSAPPGSPGAGLNPATGTVISSGNAGNLFSSTLINAKTGALLPSATGAGTLGTMPELVLYPQGMRPSEVLKEDDYQYNIGEKFNLAGWAFDIDVGYGKDIDLIYTWNSGNRSLFIDTHTTPTNFYDGSFTASQLNGTIDATHPFNVGMASPLTVAIGAEAREDLYGIGSGERASYYKEGPQSFPGFSPAAAGVHSRKNYAGYVDFAVAPIESIQLDVAGRAEHYTDFGDTEIGKITARWDITPQYAIRGTVSTGFRAPTLAEEFYTAVNVSPTAATVQFPANSAAANLLGLHNLKPETSTSYSLGIVAHPLQDLSATVDVYSITIGNRITTSSTVSATGGAINAPTIVGPAIALFGVTLDPTATQQGVTAFLNGINTLTQGVDATITYPTDFGDYGLINWTAAGNFNETSIGRINPVPAVLLAANPSATFFSFGTQYGFTHGLPNWKMGLTADWTLDQMGATLRETYYGPDHGYSSPSGGIGGEEIPNNQAGVGITDLELRYSLTDQLQLSFGGNNIFDIRPGVTGAAPASASGGTACVGGGVFLLPGTTCKQAPNQANGEVETISNGVVYNTLRGTSFDPNGGYYYGRVTFNF
ncbi:MAG TPA: TonB-dependent receptor [Rhizomicrobium sp.]|nr:TonB-dependent receptor [Rhizomicrobium sp.]